VLEESAAARGRCPPIPFIARPGPSRRGFHSKSPVESRIAPRPGATGYPVAVEAGVMMGTSRTVTVTVRVDPGRRLQKRPCTRVRGIRIPRAVRTKTIPTRPFCLQTPMRNSPTACKWRCTMDQDWYREKGRLLPVLPARGQRVAPERQYQWGDGQRSSVPIAENNVPVSVKRIQI